MSDARTPLAGLSAPELQELVAGLGEPEYRGRQLAAWIYRKAETEFKAMLDLPNGLRAALAERYVVSPLQVAERLRSSDDVDKLLVHSGDGEVFECVLLPYASRVSCCISSQIGCPMGCTFCATGLGGYDRNLTAAEMVGQYLLLQGLSERRVSHVSFMGMGEPLLNFDQLVKTIRVLHEEVGLSMRHITVSTVGLVPQIRQLADLNMPICLALSLHSPFDEIRDRLMPVNRRWPVDVVVGAVRDYAAATGRKVTFEYVMIDRLNDTDEQADALAALVQGLPAVVNLIPFNYVDTEHGFARPKRERVRAFRRRLEKHGVNVTQRVERGHDIAAACGQLAGRHKGRFARRSQISELPVVL
ncbi:MAG: 23S rRNA (adenine(2503)-C(2))-methyltransferase RlmN [Armatimonadetes bacterium]|nr:23S rRNA (adenine(2503)-C(2))-methyltransferase RlmN [Armatimonadota bacterium]